MQGSAISATSLWGLSKWSPDPACQEKITTAAQLNASGALDPQVSIAAVASLLRPLGEENPDRICGLASDQSHHCGGVLVPLFESVGTVG